ncbi:uncharacterized protein SCDLUD_002995 [Saccharomycodes ludwigii]|uniref:uncharacterized protein n=1 Tax=Saccharomycodes ludwigii TaxID=36035 RepID=UPI001E891229|nr:hypothetical protein SCDLUD_002995 [Saccharomycodes ludwigii]KAH3901499.1 hypothetical protein SCDLUD_002995 [Saccharomycodes ludwigii]
MTEIKQKLTSTSLLLSKSVQTVPISEIQLSNSFIYNTTNTNNIGKDLPFDLKNNSTLLFTQENLYSDTNTNCSTDSTTSSRRSSQISTVSSVFSVDMPTNDVKRFYSKSINNDKKETKGGKQEKYKKNEYYYEKKNNSILPMDLSNITFDTDVGNNNSTTSIDLGQKNLSLNEQRIIKNLLDCLDTQQLLKMIYAAPAVVPSKYDHVDSNDYNQNKRDYTGWLETPSCCNLDRKI